MGPPWLHSQWHDLHSFAVRVALRSEQKAKAKATASNLATYESLPE